MPEMSETTRIPGNEGLTPERPAGAHRRIYRPFHARISALLDERAGGAANDLRHHPQLHAGIQGMWRGHSTWVCCSTGTTFHRRTASAPRSAGASMSGATSPTARPTGCATHSIFIPEPTWIPYAMIEIRNDLIADRTGQVEWADRLATVLRQAAAIEDSGTGRGNG